MHSSLRASHANGQEKFGSVLNKSAGRENGASTLSTSRHCFSSLGECVPDASPYVVGVITGNAGMVRNSIT